MIKTNSLFPKFAYIAWQIWNSSSHAAGKLSSTNEIMIFPGHLSKKLQSYMISWREGVVACLDSNNYPLLSLDTKNMEPPLLWPKNGQFWIFLTDPIPVVSKWLGKI